MSVVKSPQFVHPYGFWLQNAIWTFPFAVSFALSLLISFTFIPLLTCFIISYVTAFVARRYIVNKVRPVPKNSAVLITGASTGIGYDAALRLAADGFTVFATVRKQSDADKLILSAKGFTGLDANKLIPLLLEVTDAKQINDTVEYVKKYLNENNLQFYGLINNAGYGEGGVIELMPLDSVRKQFEVNVFAPIALTQAFLPLLRQCKIPAYSPRIILVSSVVGHISTAGNGVYCASKHALEALGDALRQELRKWKIDVCLVEPGIIRTSFKSTLEVGLHENLDKEPVKGSTASNASDDIRQHYSKSVHNMLKEVGEKYPYNEPSITSDAIQAALLDSQPLQRYLAGTDAGFSPVFLAILPQTVFDFIFGRNYN